MGLNSIRKGYKQTELGEIPDGWSLETLGNIGQTIIGLTYSPNDVSDSGTLVLRSSNVQKNRLAFENNVFVNMELPPRVIVREGDILVCVRNGSKQLIGKCALIDKATSGCAFGAFMSVFRSQSNDFIFQQFQSNLIQTQINENMGATINQITNKDMAGFVVPLPTDRDEQTAIANALSDTDALITALEKLINKKRAIKTAAMQQLLTGKTRLPGFDKHPNGKPKGMKQTELGEIPEGWEVISLSDLCDVRDGTHESPTYKDAGIPLITSKNIVNDVLDFSNISLISSEDAFDINKRSKVDSGDIILSMIGTVGSAVLVEGEPNFCIKNVALFKPRKISGKFLIQLIRSSMFQDCLQDSLDGGIQKFVSLGTLRKLLILVSINELEQTAIANVLKDMDQEISILEQQLRKARQIKQGMMQELLTGRTRLV